MTLLTNSQETIMAILRCSSLFLLGFISGGGVGGVQSQEKIKKQNVNWRTGHSGSFVSITVWRTIISCLCVWEIINFRKTKYVKFIPGASDYFCVMKTGSVECSNILEAICYLLISSHAFHLSCGLKGGFQFVHKYIVYSQPRQVNTKRNACGHRVYLISLLFKDIYHLYFCVSLCIQDPFTTFEISSFVCMLPTHPHISVFCFPS